MGMLAECSAEPALPSGHWFLVVFQRQPLEASACPTHHRRLGATHGIIDDHRAGPLLLICHHCSSCSMFNWTGPHLPNLPVSSLTLPAPRGSARPPVAPGHTRLSKQELQQGIRDFLISLTSLPCRVYGPLSPRQLTTNLPWEWT